MKHRLANILCALSLLLCVAVCVLWGRSYSRNEGISYGSRAFGGLELESSRAHVMLSRNFGSAVQGQLNHFSDKIYYDDKEESSPWFPRFGYHRFNAAAWYWEVPHWALAGSLALLAISPWMANRYRRKTVGLCQICGYDLRASPERCPECGALPQLKT
jgi:hypothetical protein